MTSEDLFGYSGPSKGKPITLGVQRLTATQAAAILGTEEG